VEGAFRRVSTENEILEEFGSQKVSVRCVHILFSLSLVRELYVSSRTLCVCVCVCSRNVRA